MNDPKDVLIVTFAGWIVGRSKLECCRDHACAQCVPDGPIVIDGFVCVPHQAQAIVAGARPMASVSTGEGQQGAVTAAMTGPEENGERARENAPVDPPGAGCKASRFPSASDPPACPGCGRFAYYLLTIEPGNHVRMCGGFGCEKKIRGEALPEPVARTSDATTSDTIEAAMRAHLDAIKANDAVGEVRAMTRVVAFVPALCREVAAFRDQCPNEASYREVTAKTDNLPIDPRTPEPVPSSDAYGLPNDLHTAKEEIHEWRQAVQALGIIGGPDALRARAVEMHRHHDEHHAREDNPCPNEACPYGRVACSEVPCDEHRPGQPVVDPVAAERERCARIVEVLAHFMETGAGPLNAPGARLRQAAQSIREGDASRLWAPEYQEEPEPQYEIPSPRCGHGAQAWTLACDECGALPDGVTIANPCTDYPLRRAAEMVYRELVDDVCEAEAPVMYNKLRCLRDALDESRAETARRCEGCKCLMTPDTLCADCANDKDWSLPTGGGAGS